VEVGSGWRGFPVIADGKDTMARRRPFALQNTELPAHLRSSEKELVRLFINARCSRLLDIVAAAQRLSRAELLAICIARTLGDAELFSRESGDFLPRSPSTPTVPGGVSYLRQTPPPETGPETDTSKTDAA
jgi:hypothetical protein